MLAARTRDVAAAEDALGDAFAAALAQWPRDGVPDNPERWLLAVARRRNIDVTRRAIVAERASPAVALTMQLLNDVGDASSTLPDRRAELLYLCAHPAIETSMRAPLMLQVVLGLDAEQIAAAFLVRPSTMAQRLVRVKRKVRDAGVPFVLPDGDALASRTAAVLDAIYAAYGTGWDAVMGGEPSHIALADEALWLCRVITDALPDHAEALGLLALMHYTHARRDARQDANGAYVPLDEQDQHRWDAAGIAHAEALLRRAAQLGAPGRYQTEAAIQSAHVARLRGVPIDVTAVLSLYDALVQMAPSIGAQVARAAALARCASGDAHEAAQAAIAALEEIPVLVRQAYQPWWALYAHLLATTGQSHAATAAYERAIGLTMSTPVRVFLQQQLQQRRGGLS